MNTRWPSDVLRLKIDDLVVDIPRRRILCAEAEVELPQRVFDLLLVFMAAPGVLHSRSSLFASVWSGVIVEDASPTQTIWMLRRALGPERKHWIRTVSKSGCVFEPRQRSSASTTRPGGTAAVAATCAVRRFWPAISRTSRPTAMIDPSAAQSVAIDRSASSAKS